MKKLIPIGAVTLLFFSACMKELSEANDTSSPAEVTGALKKMVTISWPDSIYRTTEDFTYDNNGRVLSRAVAMNNYGMFTKFYRDDLGRVSRFGVASSQNNWDTVFVDVVYQSNSSSKVAYLSDSSAVFSYNSNGKIGRTDTYQSIGGAPRKLVVYHLYTYSPEGNLTKREEFTDQDNNGVFELNFTYTLEYDNKINPLYPMDDALIEWQFLAISPNNLVKQKNDPVNPMGIDDENNTVYEFRADNKPHSCFFEGGDGRKTKTYFYYYE